VPGRIGPTPRQLLPDATMWLHTRVTVSKGLPVASNESNALSNSLLIYRYLRNRLLVAMECCH
jgi:hypothetical protein